MPTRDRLKNNCLAFSNKGLMIMALACSLSSRADEPTDSVGIGIARPNAKETNVIGDAGSELHEEEPDTRESSGADSTTHFSADQVQAVWTLCVIHADACLTPMDDHDSPDFDSFLTDDEADEYTLPLEQVREEFPDTIQDLMARLSKDWLDNETGSTDQEPQPDPAGAGPLDPRSLENGYMTCGPVMEPSNEVPSFATPDGNICIVWGPYFWINGEVPSPALPFETLPTNLTWSCEDSRKALNQNESTLNPEAGGSGSVELVNF